jgi:hypothetical protein
MKRFFLVLSAIVLAQSFAVPAFPLEQWSLEGEISRLAAEAPTLAAFPGMPGVVWKSSDRYSLAPDGGKLHYSVFLLLLAEGGVSNEIDSMSFPSPLDEGASFEVTASWHDQSDGERLGELPVVEYDRNGIKGIEVLFPDESEGFLAAIAVSERVPGQYRLDDVLPMAGELPIWERTVEVEVPDGMRVYWEGVGVRDPERTRNGRTELISWSVLNEPAWKGSGLVDSVMPSLAFSLDHGQLSALKALRALENPPYAPKMPSSVLSMRSDLGKTAESISKYMSSRLMPDEAGTRLVRPLESISPEGPWTGWEQVLIAGRWLKSLGFGADIYWLQSVPVGADGPASPKIWKEPILKSSDGDGREIYFKAGQSGDLAKPHASLYGAALYRAGGNGVERLAVPRGSASEHTLAQNWKVEIDENGRASGTLDVTATGGWMDIFGLDLSDEDENMASGIIRGMDFNIPGANMVLKSAKRLSSGCRVSYSVEAVPGIVSSGSVLLKLMGGLPVSLGEIPQDGTKYTLRFPFVFEINSEISTPKGYKALSVPGKMQIGDSKAMLDRELVHWARSGRAEGYFRWTVRSFDIDEYMSGRIGEQLSMAAAWPDTTIPLRK